VQQIKDIPDLRINISINGLKPETRNSLMGLDDFWKVYQMMQHMTAEGVKYRVSMVSHPSVSIKEQQEFVESGGIVIQYQSWCGEMYPYTRKRWTSCIRALHGLAINYQGEVSLCCFDPFNKANFGDLKKESIKDVWKSPRREEYKRLHCIGRGHELPLCENCTEG